MLFEKFGEIGWIANGGCQALNLVFQFGAKRAVLVGFDMSLAHGFHWHGRHVGLNNPTQNSVDKWRGALDAQAEIFSRLGLSVIIGSPNSALQNYPKMSLMEAIECP